MGKSLRRKGSLGRKATLVKTFAPFALCAVLLALAGAALAQDGQPTDDQVNAIARQLYCPVCESVPLDVCPTQACAQWRATIREKLAAGWSEQQIKDYFAQQYGERVLAQPPARGLNILVWILPPLGVLIGGIFLWRFLRAARRAPAAAPLGAPPADDYAARLEEELAKRR